IARAAVACLIAVAILAVAIVPLKGRFVVFDSYYGAYSFANGAHEHAAEGAIRDYNGEMAMPQSVRELGLPFYGLDRNDPVIADEYMRMGMKFIHDHPVRYAMLEALKTANLFRPDYRNVDNSFVPKFVAYAMHTLIAALVLAWAGLRWLVRKHYGIADGLMLLPLAALYLVPFIATSTDPRYRIPLDVLFIVDSILCLAIFEARRRVRPAVCVNEFVAQAV
ncbi:MAG TPA: hypothetical protein VG345_13845, partial [Bryobacteraceae bacterium]|nr:hypothetical protein [Bryobacteraceae bacterium]